MNSHESAFIAIPSNYLILAHMLTKWLARMNCIETC